MSKLRKNISALINSDFTAYRISRETDISLSVIQKILNGTSKLDNISLKKAEILSKFWEEYKMKDYTVALTMVQEALQDGITYNLATAFAETRDGQMLEQIVADQFHQAANGVDDFSMTVEEYLYARLEDSENMQSPDTFENESDAEQAGFYWEDSIDKWLKLHF